MWEDSLMVWWAFWQEHSAAVALFIAGRSMSEAFLILWIGSNSWVTLVYFSPEWISYLTRKLFELLALLVPISLLLQNPDSNSPLKSNHWFWRTAIRIKEIRERLTQRVAGSKYPLMGVFIMVIIPIWGFLQAAIGITRLLGLRNGFLVIFTGCTLRTYIIVKLAYTFGGLFNAIF